jgi:predicted GTPase
MQVASRALAAGADFSLLGPARTMLRAGVPVIAVSAVRTGCGKSQVARYLAARLRGAGRRVAVIRHPMPYGDLAAARVQRFASYADLDGARCTVEEREEYEPHIALGNVVFAGVDYGAIVARAQSECDVIVWDGGNNDFPFVRPELHVVLDDALRPGHVTGYHPGEAVLRMADVVVIAKADAAARVDVEGVAAAVRALNARAAIVRGASPVTLEDGAALHGKRVVVVEDGPTITHGGMPHGAAFAAAARAGAIVVDPRPWAAAGFAAVYAEHPHIGPVAPAMGYSPDQIAALENTLNAAEADAVISGTPIDLARAMKLAKPVHRARYEFAELERPGVWDAVERFLERAERTA